MLTIEIVITRPVLLRPVRTWILSTVALDKRTAAEIICSYRDSYKPPAHAEHP